MLRSGAGVQEICNSVYRESEVASVAHKERLCVYWHCLQDWQYGVLELGQQICREEMPEKRRLRALENVRNVQRSNGTV